MMVTRARWYRLTMFALLYFVQGSALAYIWSFMKPHLNSFDIDADKIGLLGSLLLLPYILKIFIGLFSDRINLLGFGHRKPYIILGLLLAMLCFATAGFISPGENFTAFAIVLFIGSFSITIFDTTTDGLAIDITPAEDHSTVQGVMTGAQAFGLVVLSQVFGRLAARPGGYTMVFLVVAASVLLPLFLVLPVKEPPQREHHQRFEWSAFKALKRRRIMIFAVYAILSTFVSYGVNGLITYHMAKTFEAPETLIGTYGTLRGLGAVIGALGGAVLIDRLGRRASTYSVLAAISIFAILIGLAPDLQMIVALALFWGMAWGFLNTIGVALAMDLSDIRIAATMYAVMMALFNVGNALGEGVPTGLTDDIGFSAVFLLLAALNLLMFPVAYALFRSAPEIAQRVPAVRVEGDSVSAK